jgi:hypothetical protein
MTHTRRSLFRFAGPVAAVTAAPSVAMAIALAPQPVKLPRMKEFLAKSKNGCFGAAEFDELLSAVEAAINERASSS